MRACVKAHAHVCENEKQTVGCVCVYMFVSVFVRDGESDHMSCIVWNEDY